MKKRLAVTVTLLVLIFVAAPAQPAGPAQAATVAPAPAFVPVAIWEISREGFPTVRHAWVAGSDKMLRISWDDGITWFGFKPVFSDTARGLLAISVMGRADLGRGEVGWKVQSGLTLIAGQDSPVTLSNTGDASTIDVTVRLVEIKEVSPSELKPTADTDTAALDPGVVPMSGGGGGLGSCCVSCQGVRVCDCAVCIAACHTSCCLGGCFCMSC